VDLLRKHPRRQGDLGEATAIQTLTALGGLVSLPLFHSPDYDLIAELDGRLHRVQVKTSTRRQGACFVVQLATYGGNRSWNGVVKRFDASRYDLLFVLVSSGRCWLIPATEIEGSRSINLGGSKYAEFELSTEPQSEDGGRGSRIADSRGGAGVGEPGQAVNLVPQAEWVRIPPPPLEQRPELSVIARTKLSANHQLTIPRRPLAASGFEVGDSLRIEVERVGRVIVTRAKDHALT
jgi:hypothetical protein